MNIAIFLHYSTCTYCMLYVVGIMHIPVRLCC